MHTPATRLALAALLALCALPTFTATGQQHRIVFADDWTYEYVQRLQERGHLLELDPTSAPYRQGELYAALLRVDTATLGAKEARWVRWLMQEFEPTDVRSGGMAIGGALLAGFDATNNDRIDPLRFKEIEPDFYQRAELKVYAEAGSVVGAMGLTHSGFYQQDPDGFRSVRRLLIRTDDSYLSIRRPYFDITLGRYDVQWGRLGEAAGLISMNPRSYDRLSITLGGPRLGITALHGDLDAACADGSLTGQTAGFLRTDCPTPGIQRYLTAHRIHWRPTRNFQVAAGEAVLYAGEGIGPKLQYLVPFHAWSFVTDARPHDTENNAVLWGELWFRFDDVTVQGQLTLDDFDIGIGIGADEEPTAFALLGSINIAEVARDVDAGFALEVVAKRAFNAPQGEGTYAYLGRGIATQFNDYIRAELHADWYLDGLLPGLIVTPRVGTLKRGTGGLLEPYPTNTEVGTILDGATETTVRVAGEVFYQPLPYVWARVNVGVNRISDVGFAEGESATKVLGFAQVGAKIRLDGSYRLTF